MTNFLVVIIPSIIFFVIKLAFFGIRFSDTNVYFYTAQQLLKGKILYKEIFFTNLPLFPYVSSLYTFILGGRLNLYYLTPSLEVIITGLLIFFLAFKKTKNRLYAFICQSLYLFSFIILTTSDHQTGVFLASLLSILAYLFFLNRRDFLSGLMLGLMILTKAYYLPIAAAFFLYLFFQERERVLKMVIGLFSVFVVILGPIFVLTGKEFMKEVFSYSLFRPAGIDKIQTIYFFIKHDVVFIFLLLFVITGLKRNLLFFLIFTLSILAIFLYKDVYYLYLNILVPFLALSFSDFILWFEKRAKDYGYFLYLVIAFLLGINLTVYLNQYATLQKIENLEEMTVIIKKEKPQYLYGTMEVTPMLAYLSATPLLNNIIDTNDNLFYKGVLDAKTLTKDALSKKTIVVTKGFYYPLNNIDKPITGAVVKEDKIRRYCKKIYMMPIRTEGLINIITLFKCY